MAGLTLQGIQTLELDVTDDDSVRNAREATASLTDGKLDILVNNAYVLLQLFLPNFLTCH